MIAYAVLFQLIMPKNAKKNNNTRSKKQGRRSERPDLPPRAPPKVLKQVPERRNQIAQFRRATRRQIYWNPVAGLDGSTTSDMQFSFSPGATDYRLGGVSVYTDALPNLSEFTALFDQWRIKSVMMRIDYTIGQFSNSGVAYDPPLLSYVADYDDSTQITLSSMLEYPQVRIHNFQENGYTPLILQLEPVPLRDIAGSGVATGYAPSTVAPFLRTAETSIPHYGLKMALNGAGASVNAVLGYFNIIVWYDLEFTNPK
jgi:hypothetical protein